MSKYICPNCKKDFKQKSHYDDHTKYKKKPCVAIIQIAPQAPNENILAPIAPNIINNKDLIEEKKHICNYCNKKFSKTFNLNRHLDGRCKAKNGFNELAQLKNEFENMKNEIGKLKKLEKENEELKKQINNSNDKEQQTTNNNIGKIVNNTNSNNTNTNSNNTINIIKIDFGKEALSTIDNNVFFNSINNGSGASIPAKIIEGIHFDPNNKKYNTVCITDIARNIAQVYKQKNWQVTDANELVDNLFDKAVIFIDTKKEELEDIINKKSDQIKKKINKELKLINLMANTIDAYDMDDDGNRIDDNGDIVDISSIKRGERLKTKAKDNIKLSLYNNRKIVKK